MAKVSELVSQNVGSAVTNYNTWGGLVYNVKDVKFAGGAKGDSVTDDSTAILAAATAAASTGGTIFFPPSVTAYKLDIPINLVVSNVDIVGFGATIDCRGTRAVIGTNGQGGGFTITGSNNVVEGISFIGYAEIQGSTNYGIGKFLRIAGDLNNIVDCKFKDGNSGAIMLNGNKNTISICNFDTCNNHAADGADYGSIHILGGYGNKISKCWIENQYYAGISLIGNVVSKVTIENCYIKASNPLGLNTSMGIYSFTGSANDLVITNNTIENIAAECVVIFSSVAYPTDTVKIADNTFRDYGSSAVAIYQSDGGVSKNIKIQGNTCQSITVNATYPIYTEMLTHSSILNNTINGKETGVGTVATGMYIGSSPNNNIIKNNTIFNLSVGVFFADTSGGDLSENMITLCATGIQYQNCQRAKITNNQILDCTTAFNKGLNGDFAFLSGNMVSGQTTASNAPLLYGDVQTTSGATSPIATGTLVAGSASITFFNIDDGDVFIVVPFTYALAANCGSLYITDQNSSLDTMTIKSTNAADTRKFMVLKVARGVT